MKCVTTIFQKRKRGENGDATYTLNPLPSPNVITAFPLIQYDKRNIKSNKIL